MVERGSIDQCWNPKAGPMCVAVRFVAACQSRWQVVLPFVPMFHVLSWCLPFAMMMGGA